MQLKVIEIWSGNQGWIFETVIFIILIGLIWLIGRLVYFLLDRAAGRITRKTRTQIDDIILKAMKAPFYYLTLLLGLYIAFKRMGRVIPEHLEIVRVANHVLYAALIFNIAFFVYRLVNDLVKWSAEKTSEDAPSVLKEFFPLFRRITGVIIFVIATLIILPRFGIKIEVLLTTLGVSSLAIALGAQDTIANMIAGFLIMIDRPFKEGDIIQIPSGEIGEVANIGIRRTRLITADNNIVTLANADLSKSKIINFSSPGSRSRFSLKVIFPGECSFERARMLLLDSVGNLNYILKEPSPQAVLVDSTPTNFSIMFYIWSSQYREKEIIIHAVKMGIKALCETKKINVTISG